MLAIIIPYYKLTFFETTLQSLANQIDKRFKVYIGNDASPENPESVLEKYKEKFDFVYKRFETNLGGNSLVKQWERCIAMSNREEWLLILGDDDVLDEHVVAEFYANLPLFETKTNVVRYASVLINGSDAVISSVYENPTWESIWESIYKKFEGNTRSSLSEHIFSRKAYNQFGFQEYPLAWHSDDQAWIDFANNRPLYAINSAKVYIRNSDLNISGRVDNYSAKNKATILFYRKIVSHYKQPQSLKILFEYEKLLRKENKINPWVWFSLLGLYLQRWNRYAIQKFIKRSLQTVFKNG